MRRELEAAASADCTFTPRLNTEKTNKLLWKSLSSPSTMPLPEERRTLQEEAPAVTPRGVPNIEVFCLDDRRSRSLPKPKSIF